MSAVMRCGVKLLLGWLLLVNCPTLVGEDSGTSWSQWRGPRRDGSVLGGPWPDSLQDDRLRLVYRRELPPSFSGPVLTESKLFVTYSRDDTHEGVKALDAETGGELWTAEWADTMRVADLAASMGSWIRATPACDGPSLYVAGMRDLLVCLDVATGEQRWQADFHARYGTPLPEIGFVCSPLVDDARVYVQAADSLVAVDKRTGESLWRSLVREEVGQGSYSSPGLAMVHGRTQLLVANIPAIAGVDPATGEVLWKRELDSYDQGCVIAPVAYGDGVFTSTRASQSGLYRLTPAGERFEVTDVWKNKLVVYMSSPIVMGNYAYLHLKNGRFACLDLSRGEDRWISNRPFGKYCSMVWCGDRILALTDDGQLLLLRANPDRFELLDSRQISADETWGHLAVVGQRVYIRERNAIAAYEWR